MNINDISENHPFNRTYNASQAAQREADEQEKAYKRFVHQRLYAAAQVIKSIHRKKQKPVGKDLQWVNLIGQDFDNFNTRFTVHTTSAVIELTYTGKPAWGSTTPEIRKFTIRRSVLFMSNRDVAKATRHDIYRAKYRSLLVEIQDSERSLGDGEGLEKKALAKEKKIRTEAEKRIKEMRTEMLKEVDAARVQRDKSQKELDKLKKKVPYLTQ